MPFSVVKSPDRVYLDHNATTPLYRGVVDQCAQWVQDFGNPSSIHREGRGPKSVLRETRRTLAREFRCDPLEIIFTAGGSESNNTVIKGVAFAAMAEKSEPGKVDIGERNEIVITSVEHPAVKKAALSLEPFGFRIHQVAAHRDGGIDLEDFQSKISDKTLLVSCMMVNNETGTIYPIAEMTQMAHRVGALMHTDAVQALGKVPLDLAELGVDYASFSGHKFYALKGSGLLYQRKNSPLFPLLHGGGQERSRRAGTENAVAIRSLLEVARYLPELGPRNEALGRLRDQMERQIQDSIPGVLINSAAGPRVSSTSSLVIDGIDGESLLMNLDLKGFSVSTGAACSSGSPEPSPTLLAMGLSRGEAQSSLRVSLGWGTSESEIEQFVDTLEAVVDRLRKIRSAENYA